MKSAKLTKHYNNIFEKMVFDLIAEYEEIISFNENIKNKEHSKDSDLHPKYRKKSLALLDEIDSTNKQLEKFKLELEHPEFQIENILIQSDGDSLITFGIRFFKQTDSMHKYFFEKEIVHLKDRTYYVDVAIDLIKKELESLNKISDGIIEFENALYGGTIPYVPETIVKKYPDMQLEEYYGDNSYCD